MAKTKALISFAVTAKLICVFVFANAKCWFSHDAALLSLSRVTTYDGFSGQFFLNFEIVFFVLYLLCVPSARCGGYT